MTIAKRLLFLVSVAAIGMMAVGGFSLAKIAEIKAGIRETSDNVLPSLKLIEQAEVAFQRARTPVLRHMLAAPADKDSEEKRFNDRRIEFDQAYAAYEKVIYDEKDRAYFDNIRRLAAEFFTHSERIMAASRHERIELAQQLIAEQRKVLDELTPLLLEHSAYNHQLANHQVVNSEKLADQTVWFVTVTTGIALLVCGVMGFFIYRTVTQSLSGMIQTFGKVEHDLDFTLRLNESGQDEVTQAARAFNSRLSRLQQSFRDITTRSGSVDEAAGRLAAASEQMSSASGYQSESASSMAASIEELTVSINHVADRAGETKELSLAAGEMARQGGKIIGETVDGINSIAETVRNASERIANLEQQSDKINSVVSVIKDVADQTNLLALNAAIEAARAGEQGRGFAVVADEVRKLAERTTQSTAEIASTIQDMQSGAHHAVESIAAVVGQVEAGVVSAEAAKEAIRNIEDSSHQTVTMVADITEAIREQSVASTSIAQEVEKIAQMSEENSASSHSTSVTAGELAKLSQQMQHIVEQYRI